MEQGTRVDKTLDIKGLAGQRQVAVTESVLQTIAKGQTLKVVTDNAGTKRTFPLLCEHLGCTLLSIEEGGGIVSFVIRK